MTTLQHLQAAAKVRADYQQAEAKKHAQKRKAEIARIKRKYPKAK